MRLFLLLSFAFFLIAADPPRQANEAFERGDYAEAEALLRDAIRENPGDYRLHFNLGNTLANQGKFDEAIESYERFQQMAPTAKERAMADYNIGNIHAFMEDWQQALEQYRASLRQNPDDDDAVSNFEYALRQQQEQQEQQQSDQGEEGEQDQEQSEQDQQSDGQDDQQGDEQQQQQSPDDAELDDDSSSQSLPQDFDFDDMTPEEAEQLLNAIENNEKELIKNFLKDLTESPERDEKDW